MYKKKNFAVGTISAQLPIDGTTLTLQPGEGDLFPPTGSDNYFVGVIWGSSYSSPQSDQTREIVVAYRLSGDTFTITRAQEGTSAKQWEVGDNFMLTATAAVFDEYENTFAPKDYPVFTGNVGIRVTDPTAYLHLAAGTASANTAPIKFTAGVLNTTPEAGAIEFDGNDFYLSI